MAQLIELGALWRRTSKTSGETYLSGTIQIDGKAIELRIFPNKYKKNDKQPDFRIMTEGAEDQPAPRSSEPEIQTSTAPEYPEEQINPEDIPF